MMAGLGRLWETCSSTVAVGQHHGHAEHDVEDLDNTDVTELYPLSDLAVGEVWAMVESSPDGMILADEHGVMLVVNSKIETLFGYDRVDLLGRHVEVLLPERYRRVHTAHRTRYRAEPKSRAMGEGLDLLARRSNGSEFPVEVSLSPVTTKSGLRVVATVRDIAHRLAVEAHSHAVLHTIDAARDGVFMFPADTMRFSYVNQGAVTQLGYERDELLAMSPLHIKPEFTEVSFRELLRPLLDGEVDSHVFTTVHRRKDGRDVPVEIILEYPPAISAGQPRMLVALVRNITQRLQSEEALRASEANVGLLEDRERLASDLHDLVIQRLFAAGMGLQGIRTLVDNPQAATRIDDTVNELDETITELRSAIFHLTTDSSGSNTDSISRVIDHATQSLGFPPTLVVHGDLETIPGAVAEQLVPVLTEALSNVAHHAKAARADVMITAEADTVELTVTDDGIGFDPDAPRGHGLDNMRSRALRVNGSATVTNNSAGGTTLTWTATC